MWNRKLIVTRHVIERFKERIDFFDKVGRRDRNIVGQVLRDLQPRNVAKIERLDHEEQGKYKVITRHNKAYILLDIDGNKTIVKTAFEECSIFGGINNKRGVRARARDKALAYLKPIESVSL